MRASNFKRFLKSVPAQITAFTKEADEKDGDDQWESAVHRYSAARILVWILGSTGATLRNHQLIKAWMSIVTKCWNMEDFTTFTQKDYELILNEVKYEMRRFDYHKMIEEERGAQLATRKLAAVMLQSGNRKISAIHHYYKSAYQ